MKTEGFVQSTMDRARYWREKTLLLREAIRSQQKGMTRLRKRIVAMQWALGEMELVAESNPKMTFAEVSKRAEEIHVQYVTKRAEERLEKKTEAIDPVFTRGFSLKES